MDRVLDAAMQIPGFDAAMIVVEGHAGAPTIVTRGMTPQETAKPPTSGVAGALPGTITVTYRYGRDRVLPESEVLSGGVFIPLVGRELAPIGTLSLFWRVERPRAPGRRDRAGGEPRGERDSRDRERSAIRRGTQASGDRRADRPLQPAVLPRDASAGGAARAALRAQPRAHRLRRRRLQVDQRPDRPPRGRPRARTGRRPAAGRRPVGRRRLPHRRRRVRGASSRSRAPWTRTSSTDACRARCAERLSARTRSACVCRPGSRSSSTAIPPPGSSSVPTQRCTARRISARTGRTSPARSTSRRRGETPLRVEAASDPVAAARSGSARNAALAISERWRARRRRARP